MRPYGFANAAIRLFLVYLGMGTIRNLYSKVKQVDMDKIITDSIEQTKDAAVQFNKDDLSVGLLSTSNAIVPQYSASYAKKKGFTTPDLYVTGDFYGGISVEVQNDSLLFNSSDEKSWQLEARYTKYIFGLTKDSKTEYSIGVLKPILTLNLRNAMGL